jgi:hypothetical protein
MAAAGWLLLRDGGLLRDGCCCGMAAAAGWLLLRDGWLIAGRGLLLRDGRRVIAGE